MGINTNAVQRLYTAYFSRPADPVGLAYWESKLPADRAATQAELTALAHSGFSASTEFSNMYTGLTNAQIVQLAYQNLFGRSAEPAGEVYWAARLASGAETFAGLVLQLTYSAQGTDATAIASKLSAATAFTAALDTTAEITGYAGTGSSASARGWLATVTDAATLATATAAATLNAAVAAAVAAGSTDGGGTTPNGTTFTLTNGTDNATANVFNASLVYTPAGNARINALQDEDTLTGAGVNATLNATLGNIDGTNAGAQGTIVTPKLSGISTVNVAFTGSGGTAVNELDLQDSTAPTAVNITRVSDGIATATVDNMKAVPTTMSITDSNNAQQSVSFLFTNGGASGAADASTMTLSNVNVATLTVQENASDGTVDQGVESLTLVSSGSANTITTLRAEDLQTLTINGSQNMTIGGQTNVAGSLTTVAAGALTGNLTFTLANGVMGATPDGASNGNVAFSLTSGTGNDSIRVSEQIGTNDSIATGAGTDTLRLSNGTAATLDTIALNTAGNNVTGVENIQLWNTDTTAGGGTANVLALRADEAEGDQAIELRDHTNAILGADTTTYNVVNLSANEANTISIAHSGSTTLAAPAAANNALADNFVDLDVADGVTAVNLTITNGVNSDNRFNFSLYTDSDRTLATTGDTSAYNAATAQDSALAGAANAVTSLTLTDSDNESNTVQLLADGYLAGAVQGNGTAYTSVTLAGGTSGTFMNLDATANAFGFDTTGASTGDTNVVTDVAAGAAERLSAATINASAMSSNVVVRVGNNFNSATGAQSITMGSGSDTVIFDMLADTRAGLTISDTVAGGTGSDTLAIDGNGVAISLGASEWTNVTGFETIRLISNGVASNNALLATNAYNLTLTDLLVDNNGTGGSMIAIVNDNDDSTTAAGAANVGATIDARALAANNAFSYNGQETSATAGTAMTADRFVFADVNINGSSVIDGGADQTTVGNGTTSGLVAGHRANADILEVRNAAVVSAGDLANITNVGVINFTNDTATAVSSTLELNNAIVDAMVNSTAAADGTSTTTIANTVETLTIAAVDNPALATATTALNMQTAGLTNAALQLNVTGGGAADVLSGGAGADTISGGAGNDTITSGAGNDVVTGGTGADSITSGEGADTITIGDGLDTIVLTETTAAADNLIWATAFAAGSANAATVTDFAWAAGVDTIDVQVNLTNGTTAATSALAGITPVAQVNDTAATANDVIFTFAGAGDLLAAGTTVATAVANAVTALTSGTDFSSANIALADSLILQMNDGTNTFVFHYVASGVAATTETADLALIGMFNGTTAALLGDFI